VTNTDTTLDRVTLVEMMRRLVRCRAFDERVRVLHARAQIAGTVHLSIGQEGEIVGACMALRDDDLMVGNHRSHGHPIGKGADMRGLMAELFGKVTGVNRGKGGSMHLADFSVGSVGETSIVGTGIPIAAGAALACKLLGDDRVCLCFFGDGAANTGAFHEGLNLASIWQLPAIFLCENNLYASGTPISTTCAVENIADRAASYAMPGIVVDGQDALAVHQVVSNSAQRARAGGGPTLVEAKTYRYEVHSGGLGFSENRPPEELEAWKQRDPLVIHRSFLVQHGVMTESEIAELEQSVLDEVEDAVRFARESPYPEPEDAYRQVYSMPLEES
jgi:pyruvate dehydrogenase E1 component alpha subunit